MLIAELLVRDDDDDNDDDDTTQKKAFVAFSPTYFFLTYRKHVRTTICDCSRINYVNLQAFQTIVHYIFVY
jgi:hypothetical protein